MSDALSRKAIADLHQASSIRPSMGHSRIRNRRGVAIVEFAVVLPLLLTLLVGTWEVGRLAEARQVLEQAAGVGGRLASTGTYKNTEVQQAVVRYLQSAGLPTTNVTVAISNLTNPSFDAKNAVQMDKFRLTVTMPFQDVRWSATTLVVSSATQIVAEVTWYSARDRDYPADATPPAGY
jgi:Flp pilus assembly protein TadG